MFYWQLEKAARRILEAVSLALSLTPAEKDYLFDLHSGHNNQLRMLHYPPISTEKLRKNVVARMPAHRDWWYEDRTSHPLAFLFSTPLTLKPSTFTLLFQDECGGLEFEDPNHVGSFLPALPVPGALTLNVGDMLQRLSNGAFFLNRFKPLKINPISTRYRRLPIRKSPR